MITISQIKGARGILDWTQDRLAAAAKISRPPLARPASSGTDPFKKRTPLRASGADL
jgi:hypothetical protein